MNSVFGLWANILPERTMGCAFNLEYLLVGGRDQRIEGKPYFMWYDWMVGGWGGRNGHDGFNAKAPVFGAQYGLQPFEGQERLAPVTTSGHELVQDSAGPGTWRGGLGAEKGGTLYAASIVSRNVPVWLLGGAAVSTGGLALMKVAGAPRDSNRS